MRRAIFLALIAGGILYAQSTAYDLVIRHGTIIDGTGRPRFRADVGIRGGHIAAIGNLDDATAVESIDATALFVTPGFINIHSHASPDALATAVNMLTQGVTTEIFNADGSGSVDLPAQLARVSQPGLAVNIGGYIGFNVVWQTVVGNSDRRATPDEIDRMRGLIAAGLDQGAWGVSAGLDYKPAYFAQTEEVVRIIEAARPARTNFTNHDRVTPESNFSSRAGIAETLAIGARAGVVPVVTHMKVTGSEKGTAGTVLASIAQTTRRGHYAAADAYPYLAGQSGLGSLIIPGWAQEGGRPEMLKRFADPAMRARIVKESEEAMAARFGGPQGVYLPRTQQELTAVMAEMKAGAGETIVRILEQGNDPGAILRFGAEEDLIKILKDPATSMACDCGATTETRVHPRFYGSFPRVFGHYVRDEKILTWEEAVRKSTWLPASTIGMTDRGVIAVGMAADVAVIDPATIADKATYDKPSEMSQGVRFVVVNGRVALEDGARRLVRSGLTLYRTPSMPSRPVSDGTRALNVSGIASHRKIAIALTQNASARSAKGTLTIENLGTIEAGLLQTTTGWAAVSGTTGQHAVNVIIDLHDPHNRGSASVIVDVDGNPWLRGSLPATAVTIR
jgi:N-acyl-D-amino-acid deacylase